MRWVRLAVKVGLIVAAGWAFVAAFLLGPSPSDSGCDDFPSADSDEVPVGEATRVELTVRDGDWEMLDFSGQFWLSDAPVPALLGRKATVEARATRLFDREMDVRFGDDTLVRFKGPIACA